jgi:hypothetical protein
MKEELLQKLEQSLRLKGKLPKDFCLEFADLRQDDRAVFARALVFLGCKNISIPTAEENWITDEKDRIRAASFMLLRLHVSLGEPVWSSQIIEDMWEYVLEIPGGEFNDLYKALWHLLDTSKSDLSLMEARFIQAVTFNGRIQFFSKYKDNYVRNDFKWMLEINKRTLKNWEAYLLMYALPREYFSPELTEAILKVLAGTEYLNKEHLILP